MDKETKISILEKENAYLKELLKRNNIDFEMPKEIFKYDLSSNEKIKSYMSYFIGRDDIFAFSYINKDGKKAFLPACKNRIKLVGYCPNNCKECINKQYIGISEKEYLRHLKGSDIFGIYPLLKDDKCWFLALDFDDKDFKDSVIAFIKICKKYGFDYLIEISSSGKGAHVWLFFDSPIKAIKARILGMYLLSEAMNASRNINFSSFDRMFPSQDYAPKNGYGNLIVLPLQGKLAKEGKTIFVDDNFVPYDLKEQIDVLLSTKKIKEEEIDLLIKEFKKDDVFLYNSKNILKGIILDKDDFAKEIVVIKQNEIVIPKTALSNRSIKFVYRLAALPNPAYYEAQRQRRSTYKIPMVLKLYREDESFIYLPRGCYEDLIKVLNFFNVRITLIDKQTSGEMISVYFNGALRDMQKDGLDKLLEYDNGIFVAPTAYGKTITAIALISELKLNTLIIVPNINLLNQWVDKLNTFLTIGYEYDKENNKFGKYYGAKKKLTNNIDVACIDSLVSNENSEILKNYGLIIIDEVHHVGASTYEQVMKNCYSKYLYGFTATPKRSDKNEKIVYKTIGDIRYQYKDINGDISKILMPKFTFFTFKTLDKMQSYVDKVSVLLNDEERNENICIEIQKAYKDKRNILVLTDRIEHINLLRDKLRNIDNLFIISGQSKANEKKFFYEKLNNCDNGFVILSTGKYVGEGFDEKKLDTLFIISPFKWNGTLEQYVGRLHRKNCNKKDVLVYDYIDINVKTFENMYHERLRGYKRLGYTINDEDINFEQKIFNTYAYRNKLLEDVKAAKEEVVLIISDCGNDYLNEILDLNDRIKIYSSFNFPLIHKNIKDISRISLEINAVIIDKKILWYGGINPFKEINHDDSIVRINDRSIVDNFIKEINKK